MEKLPTELLEKIFLYLRGPDRLSAALVCKRWDEIVSASRSLRDVCLVLSKDDLQRATPTLLHSHRQYTNLKICRGTLYDFNQEFWARIAGDLVTLQLESCALSVRVFYGILGECRKLQSLDVSGDGRVGNLGYVGFEYPEDICVAKLQQSLRNVRHLSLRLPGSTTDNSLSDASFNRLFTLMPNITSLCLEDYRYPPASLTLQSVLVCMMRSEQEFVDLDFSGTLIDDDALIQILELYRESLTDLRLGAYHQLTAEVYEAIGECSKLRFLSFDWRTKPNDDDLECILTKTPDLEYLELGCCELISSQSLRLIIQLIIQLKKLRHLNLSDSRGISIDSWGSLRALTELQHLDLSDTNCDVEAFRQLASLTDLRSLVLRYCSNLDSECVAIICNSFKRLEKLDLDSSITNKDGEGCEFHQLKYLRSLDITKAKGISSRSLKNGMGAPDMKSLSMGYCRWLTDSVLVSIANHHGCLEYLDLGGCDQITDVGLISAVQCLPRLRTLILDYCRSLTDRSLHALQDLCPRLRELHVRECLMSDNAIELLEDLRPSLRLFL